MIELDTSGWSGGYAIANKHYYRNAKKAFQTQNTSLLSNSKEWTFYNKLVDLNKQDAEQKKNINQRDSLFADNDTNTMGNNDTNTTSRNTTFTAQQQTNDNISQLRKRRGFMFSTNLNNLLGN